MSEGPKTSDPRRCPGQAYSISEAVCRARQSANFFLCPICQNKAGSSSQGNVTVRSKDSRDMKSTLDSVFKAYDIRGIYPDPLNEEIAWKIGHAAANFLRSQVSGYARSEKSANSLVVGRDARPSSVPLQNALIEGISTTDTDTIDIGLVDTPLITFAVNHLGVCGGIQVTASHNPAEYNGFKLAGQGAKPVGQDTGLWEVKRIAEAVAVHKSAAPVRRFERDLWPAYREFVRKFLDKSLRPLKVVVDASNGCAGKLVPAVFNDLPITIVPLNFAPLGQFAHEPNPMLAASQTQARQAVLAQHADFGVCFDGDADRCIFIDEQGQPIHCDLITALLAGEFLTDNRGATVVFDVRTSRVVPEEITRAGGVPRRERVGHVFIKKAMAEAKGIFAGEGSGHFYFKDNWYADSGALVFAHMLNVVSKRRQPLSSLLAPLKRYAASGELNFRNERKDQTIAKLLDEFGKPSAGGKVDTMDGLRIDFDDWWFSVRKSNTEPLLRLNTEAKTEALLAAKLKVLAPTLGEQE